MGRYKVLECKEKACMLSSIHKPPAEAKAILMSLLPSLNYFSAASAKANELMVRMRESVTLGRCVRTKHGRESCDRRGS